jgi:hypothetical protein
MAAYRTRNNADDRQRLDNSAEPAIAFDAHANRLKARAGLRTSRRQLGKQSRNGKQQKAGRKHFLSLLLVDHYQHSHIQRAACCDISS